MFEILFSSTSSQSPVLHLESPARQPWDAILKTLAAALSLPHAQLTPYNEWLGKVQALPDPERNPCIKILPFLQDEFVRMASGDVVLDTARTQQCSETLSTMEVVSDELIKRYVAYWKGVRFLA